jgi:thymidylate synthase
MRNFIDANTAFEFWYNMINNAGVDFDNTKALFNVGFLIDQPSNNIITNKARKWKQDYAELEWRWYESGNSSAKEIAKHAKIWYKCMDEKGNVNSNYGCHWQENNQLEYVIDELKKNPKSRRASISIYNGKDRYNWENDTPCTYAINFYIYDNKLNMNVMMRSNDLWYGFCNDQYCFSKLMILVSHELDVELGKYYHFANNLHIYNNFLNRKI